MKKFTKVRSNFRILTWGARHHGPTAHFPPFDTQFTTAKLLHRQLQSFFFRRRQKKNKCQEMQGGKGAHMTLYTTLVQMYHPNCLTCSVCSTPLVGKFFLTDGEFVCQDCVKKDGFVSFGHRRRLARNVRADARRKNEPTLFCLWTKFSCDFHFLWDFWFHLGFYVIKQLQIIFLRT